MEPKEILEEILNNNIIISEKDKNILYLPKDMPELISRGENQSVIRLDGQYVGKIATLKMSNNLFVNHYEGDIVDSTNNWKELGFNVPQQEFYYLRSGEKFSLSQEKSDYSDRPKVIISPDIAEDGRYKIITYKIKNAWKLKNGEELINEYQEGFYKIKDIESNPVKYALQALGHVGSNGSIDKAIRHMFLLKIDPIKNTGELILGDTDHLLLYKT